MTCLLKPAPTRSRQLVRAPSVLVDIIGEAIAKGVPI
jgi:hypothetical protein